MGRKKLPDDEVRSSTLLLRLTVEERAELEAAAAGAESLSAWARDILLRAARRRRRPASGDAAEDRPAG
jgi:hypothetical protein